MDELTAYAACAVAHDDENAAERWFHVVTGAYAGLPDDGDWTAFRTSLAESSAAAGFPAVVTEQFAEYVESLPVPLETVADMHAEGPDQLLAAYRDWLASAGAEGEEGQEQEQPAAVGDGGAGDSAPGAEAAWNAYLAQNGPYWDGTEESWPGFREWFLYHAEAAGVGDTAEAFLNYADVESDRVALFAQYGVQIAGTAEAADAAADDRELAAEVAAMTEDERAELLNTTLSEHDLDEAEDEEVSTPASLSIEAAVEQVAEEIIGQFRSQHPEFAELSDDDIRMILSEIIGEVAADAAGEPRGEPQPA